MIKECFVAELKMYEKGRGVELSDVLSYDVIYKDEDGNYRNLFNKDESFTTLERVRNYSNYYYTDEGDEIPYGTKVKLVSEKDKTGPCRVLTGTRFENIKENDLENMIICSEDYYKNRIGIIGNKYDRFHVSNLKEREVIFNDLHKLNKLNEFFNERGVKDFNSYHYERVRGRRK